MCIRKQRTLRRQSIDMRSLNEWMAIQTPDPVVQIVDRNEKHIWLLLCPAYLAQRDDQQKHNQKTEATQFHSG